MLVLGQQAIGISIEESAVRYISVKKNKTWEVRKKGTLALPSGMIVENRVADSEALLGALKPWVKQEGLRGARVSLAIPPAQIIIRKMSIPSTNEKELEQLVKLEVETGLHLPFENPVYDYVTTGVDEDQSQLLVFAAPRQSIQDYIDVLEAAGLRVQSVEISATALARTITAGQGELFNETMLIHLEQSMLDIYMYRDGNPVFSRTINVADLHQNRMEAPKEPEMTAYVAEAAASLEMPEEVLSPEQMVEITAEISRMLNFYQYSLHDGSTRISNVLITGTPGIRRQLHAELRQSLTEQEIIPVNLDQLEADAGQDPELNSYRVATGAAFGHRIRHIDLLPREDREAVLFPYVVIALVGLWLLGTLGIGIYFASGKGELSDQKQQLQGLQARSAMLQSELTQLNNGGSAKLDRKAAIDEIMKYKLNIVSVLNELAEGLPQGSALRNINYTYLTSIDLTVNVPGMEQASEYLVKLRKMSFTVDASIEKLSEGEADSGSAASLAGAYTAIYKVNLKADNPVTATQNNEGGAAENGTDQ
ncbi:pilus assembly protein PilM [Paenibacillus ihuae]|uniref:pilus assembly protein PilM n=1 Tax=Paenibacillus ihuae TaxID=1232431 RepID=UPI0006D57C11|nr:pilus assembly protein PilM [Paenibacillus ihuae]